LRRHVFIDSGAFIAFLDRSDNLHGELLDLFSRRPGSWSTSTLVLSETYSWFLHRLGEDPARTFRLFTEELPGLTVQGANDQHRAAVSAKLEALRGCKLTYVDASSLVWLEQKRIRTVWGTDHHLAIEGAKVVPGAPAR
jgi:predicted nucleic acid-binding protein